MTQPTTTAHTIACERGPTTVQATSHVPGLLVYRIPEHVDTNSPHRWRLGHHSGLAIAAALSEYEAHAGAHEIADHADWTRPAAEIRAALAETGDLYEVLALTGCHHPNT